MILRKFKNNTIDVKELFPISGGSGRTQSGSVRTSCPGADSDMDGEDKCG